MTSRPRDAGYPRSDTYAALLAARARLRAVNIPGAGVVAQLAPMLGDKGLPQESAALVMSIYASGLLLGRLRHRLLAGSPPHAARRGGDDAHSRARYHAAARAHRRLSAVGRRRGAMIGLQQGSEVDLIGYIVSRTFGLDHYGTIYGALGVAGAVSTAASFAFFGKVHDLTGSYDFALIVGIAAFCLGAIGFAASGLADVPRSNQHLH